MIGYILAFVVGVIGGAAGLLLWLVYFGVPAMVKRTQQKLERGDDWWRTGEYRLDDDIYG